MPPRLDRRTLVLAAGALALPAPAIAAVPDEVTIGAATARVHLIEYASTTCSHCAEFHHNNWATLKANYIDTGRIRYSMREMATPPPMVAVALFQLARCEAHSNDEYFRRVAILFERQRAIFETGSMQGVLDMMVAIGGEWGLSAAQVNAAVEDPAGVDRLNRSIREASSRGIDGTPAFLINGQRVDGHDFETTEGMRRILDASLA